MECCGPWLGYQTGPQLCRSCKMTDSNCRASPVSPHWKAGCCSKVLEATGLSTWAVVANPWQHKPCWKCSLPLSKLRDDLKNTTPQRGTRGKVTTYFIIHLLLQETSRDYIFLYLKIYYLFSSHCNLLTATRAVGHRAPAWFPSWSTSPRSRWSSGHARKNYPDACRTPSTSGNHVHSKAQTPGFSMDIDKVIQQY